MLIAWVMIEPAEDSDGYAMSGRVAIITYITLLIIDSYMVGPQASSSGLPLVKLHCHWSGNRPAHVHFELRQDRPNVAVLKDVDRVMLPIAFDVHAGIEGDPPEIMHSEPLLHLILDLPNQALISNDKEIIDPQNDCGDDFALTLQHEQSSVDM